ncbi:helix-turn-helix transcriptional regulator [Pseudomonas sp. CC120222-01a]|uniref:helix-turn-helix domain-containing protein n=1 Tax=Pseudomonas sp. CC120222-01a TaxID=1378075 RepID=UPI000D8D0E99|nr:helix-turn-helix transcriptional regulator [Pseudomonas sp. CC120222-01a]PVZ42160.1 PAS domain S-box-containing protein [Pseudomonas sp. CC120222-01a]
MQENSFAFRLKELLEHNKLTLQAVGTALGISRTAVHKWTKGGEIDYDNLRKLADFLRVNWIWLRYGQEALSSVQHAEPVELPMTDLRRRYAAEIMENEARMKLAQEAARIVTWEWNLISDELTYSPNVEDVYGWTISANEDFWSHLPEEDVEAMQAMYDRIIRSGENCEYDYRMSQPDGSVRWISSRSTVVHDAAGRPIKIVGISMDNTARKLTEEALRTSEERFRSIFELSEGALAFIHLDGRLQRVNDSLCALLGYSQQDLCALNFQQITHPDDLQANLSLLVQLLAGSINRYVVEKRVRCGDGSYKWVRVRTSIQRQGDGAADYLISVFEDIHAAKVEQQALLMKIEALESQLAGSPIS